MTRTRAPGGGGAGAVSYVVTVYNKAPYLPYVIAGLAAQSGDFQREYIFVNDGSTDDSGAVLRRLTAGWSDVTIIDQENRGPAHASIAAVAGVRHAFIKPVGGDDVLTPTATRALLAGIRETGCGLAFGRSGRYRAGAGGDGHAPLAPSSTETGAVSKITDSFRYSVRRPPFSLVTALARTDLVRAAGGLDPRLYILDYAIALSLARRTCFARVDKVIFLEPECAPGRMSENQAQEQHDTNLALALQIADHPEIAPADRRLALQRATSRAWLWARRHGGKTVFSVESARYLRAKLGLGPADAAAMGATCAPFRATHDIRLMTPLPEHLRPGRMNRDRG
ncbi:MAG: glycosyltransferase family 2 protein [Rhodospirillales bacterium]